MKKTDEQRLDKLITLVYDLVYGISFNKNEHEGITVRDIHTHVLPTCFSEECKLANMMKEIQELRWPDLKETK